ncbi:MAG: menaquinol-cytochrome c reductase cytochrome b subunit [Chloroflexota bacterium]|nr:MAG: menaquinol-cytochrome c reductase cytochrome b subunit [Chloroflexota bacterium]
MSDDSTKQSNLPQPAQPAPPAEAPAAPRPAAPRTAVPAAPAERRTTEIDKQRVPMAAKPYRLLALVKQDAVVRVQKEPDDTVLTWPHLLSIEFFAAAMISIFLLFMGLFVNAPLEELANGNVTPAVAKAPWYFVGLQELLAYFHPTVAGVLAPTFILVGAALVPFIDRGPKGDGGSAKPSDRKTGILLFSFFCIAGLTVTLVGAFFRGPGYSWTLPWVSGLEFAL